MSGCRRRRLFGLSKLALGTLSLCCVTPAAGQEVGATLAPDAAAAEADAEDEIVVTGRRARRIGEAQSASEGGVSGEDLRIRPLLRTSELAEAVPGLIAVQHSGGGKAAQYLIRGYNLDHGTDFSISLDGLPMNLRSHAHGHGYLDLNGLIPETVERIDYRKGPYRAADGDFSAVAAASIRTADRFERPFASATVGSYGYRRLAAGASFDLFGGTALLAGELKANDGIWQLPERLRHIGLFGKYSVDTPAGMLRVGVSVYNATWRPTEQIPVRAIGTLVADRFGTLDPFLRGRTAREMVTVGLESEALSATVYAQRYSFNLLSNFTFFLNDTVNGDELEQAERRRTYGGRVERRFGLSDALKLAVGADVQADRIGDLGLYATRSGEHIATTSLVDGYETSIGGYFETRWTPVARLNLLGGARVDHFRFRTVAKGGAAADGKVFDTIVTPKLGANFAATKAFAVYASYGQGFHSNSLRGVTAPIDPVSPLSRATGYEVGARLEQGPLILTLDRWWSRSASELVYSGDDGTVSPTGPSRRNGYEATLNVRPFRWLLVDAVYATNHARFRDAPGFDRIPNALESAGELGVAVVFPRFDAALRVRHLGSHPLIEDNSVRAPSTTVVNLRGAARFGRIEITGELLNLFNSSRADADYFYASRLPGEPLEGIEGVHSRAVEPRTVRVGAKITF